jgi:neuroligin
VITLIAAWLTSSPVHGANKVVESSRTVTTKYGDLRGVMISLNSPSLDAVEAFLGVPYATPPLGNLRYMPPMTPSTWTGVRVADRLPPVCPQMLPDISNKTEALLRMPASRYEFLKAIFPYLRNQSEDCLHMNVYVPTKGQCCVAI